MKKNILAAITSIALLCGAAFGANPTNEFTAGIDLTGYTSVSGSLLSQLVNLGRPAANRGIVIISSTTPDTATYPAYTNFLWHDLTDGVLKMYNGTAWASTTVSSNTIGNAQIVGSAVTSDKIAASAINTTNINDLAVTAAKIDGYTITETKYGAGSVSTRALANNSVDTDKLATNAVSSNAITNGAVTLPKMAANSVDTTVLTNRAVTTDKLSTNAVRPYMLDWYYYGKIGDDGTVWKGNNIASVSRGAAGLYAVTFTAAAASTNYIVNVTVLDGANITCKVQDVATSGFGVKFYLGTGSLNTTNAFYVTVLDVDK